jgi:biotin transport system substrate-specific component
MTTTMTTERSIVLIALFAALVAVLGLIPPIPLGAGVPVTAQSLGVMLCGTVLGARRGSLAILLFLAMVAVGLPVLAGGRGGLGVFTSPTGGFLLGFLPGAFVAGLIAERWRGVPVWVSAAAGAAIGCVLVLYTFGISGLMLLLGMGLPQAAAVVVPFLLGDAIKVGIAAMLTHAIVRARPGLRG